MSTIRGNHIAESERRAFRVDGSDIFAVQKIKSSLVTLLEAVYNEEAHQLVVLCIGTDRSTGDALGPLIGTKLRQLRPRRTLVLGTLDDPVHAVNLAQTLEHIKNTNESPFIIAIDACLGRIESVGCVDIGSGPTRPGAGVSKELPAVGEIYINGIVNIGGFLDYFVLQNTRLSIVVRLADTITRGIYFSLQTLPSPGIKQQKKAVRS